MFVDRERRLWIGTDAGLTDDVHVPLEVFP